MLGREPPGRPVTELGLWRRGPLGDHGSWSIQRPIPCPQAVAAAPRPRWVRRTLVRAPFSTKTTFKLRNPFSGCAPPAFSGQTPRPRGPGYAAPSLLAHQWLHRKTMASPEQKGAGHSGLWCGNEHDARLLGAPSAGPLGQGGSPGAGRPSPACDLFIWNSLSTFMHRPDKHYSKCGCSQHCLQMISLNLFLKKM